MLLLTGFRNVLGTDFSFDPGDQEKTLRGMLQSEIPSSDLVF